MPSNISAYSLEQNYFVGGIQVDGFYTGNHIDAGINGYWTYVPEHTTFAMTNDDACLVSNLPAIA